MCRVLISVANIIEKCQCAFSAFAWNDICDELRFFYHTLGFRRFHYRSVWSQGQALGIGRPVAIATPLIEAVLSMAGPIAAKAANRPKPISGLPLTPCRLGHPSIFLIVTKYQA